MGEKRVEGGGGVSALGGCYGGGAGCALPGFGVLIRMLVKFESAMHVSAL